MGAGPLDHFKIISYLPIKFFGYSVDFTNSSLAMLIAISTITVILVVLPRISKFFRAVLEIYCDFIGGIVSSNMPKKGEFFTPLVSSIFSTIFFGNMIGLVPNIFTFTSHLFPNLFISSVVVFVTVCVGFYKNGLDFLSIFYPSGVPTFIAPLLIPIEIFQFFVKIPTLALRLCINMTVGHVLIDVFLSIADKFGSLGFIVVIFYIIVLFTELFIGALQAYLFSIISCGILKNSVDCHH